MDGRRLREIQSRRDFFKRYGIGTAALAHLMREEGRTAETPCRSFNSEGAPFHGKSEERHLPFYGRRPEPGGSLRSEARAEQVERFTPS